MLKVKVTGLAGLKAEFASVVQDLPRIVDGELQTMAQEWVRLAKSDAPADQAALKGAITFYKKGTLQYEVVAQKFYAPFMEFGTKGKYLPIPGTESIAASFKGYKGGDFYDFLNAILDWVVRKGIASRFSVKTRKAIPINLKNPSKGKSGQEDYQRLHDTAWAIALSIIRHGIRPHPFFFKQMAIVWPQMVRAIEARIASRSRVAVTMPGDINRPKIITV